MIALQIQDIKNFMSKLLLSQTFDHFLLVEGSITTFNTFRIEGRVHKDFFSEEELEENWVLIRIVFLILGVIVGTFGTIMNILSLFGGYVNWLGLIVSPIILVAVIRYINKNGWPK